MQSFKEIMHFTMTHSYLRTMHWIIVVKYRPHATSITNIYIYVILIQLLKVQIILQNKLDPTRSIMKNRFHDI
jgi:hypothetical protein